MHNSNKGITPIATISPRIKMSTSRDPSQDFCQPTSGAHFMRSRFPLSAGTKSLNSSPLMVAKTRRGLPSLQHGEPLYPGDRYSSANSSNFPISNVKNSGPSSLFPVENDSCVASLPRNRRLSGSQQQEGRIHIQYQPTYMASTGYRSDSTIDRKNFSGIHRASNLRASHVSRTANFDTGNWNGHAYQGAESTLSSFESDVRNDVSSKSEFRSANSLESLDFVTNSIQQARANSLSSSTSTSRYFNEGPSTTQHGDQQPQHTLRTSTRLQQHDTERRRRSHSRDSLTIREPSNNIESTSNDYKAVHKL